MKTINERIDSETVLLRIPNHEVRDSLYDGYIARLFGRDFLAFMGRGVYLLRANVRASRGVFSAA